MTNAKTTSPPMMASEIARQLEALMPDLRRVARQLSPNWARADDLVQTALMALWATPDRLSLSPGTLRDQAFAALRDASDARNSDGAATRNVA